MRAYRVWIRWPDGVEAYCSSAYEKPERTETERARLEEREKRRKMQPPGTVYVVRPEELPRTVTPTFGEPWTADTVYLGDDVEPTRVTQ